MGDGKTISLADAGEEPKIGTQVVSGQWSVGILEWRGENRGIQRQTPTGH